MAAKVKIEVKGIDKILKKMEALGQDVLFEVGRALYQEAEGTMAEAKELVPVDTGALRASSYINLPRDIGGVLTVEYGFGGAAAPYALIVHEDLEAKHKPPTQAKYLETPFNRRAKDFDKRIGAALKARLA